MGLRTLHREAHFAPIYEGCSILKSRFLVVPDLPGLPVSLFNIEPKSGCKQICTLSGYCLLIVFTIQGLFLSGIYKPQW
jgi:hypothetical protein